MSKTREILRIRWQLGLSVREASRATGASVGAVNKTENRARAAGLTWELVDGLSEQVLDQRLYGGPKHWRSSDRTEPDPVWIHRELRRKGVTLELLHLEYLQAHPEGLRYTAFCDRYRDWVGRQGPVLRQVHPAGAKCFVDYSGHRPHFIDATSGERIEVELFVAVLGASNLTFVTTTLTQRIADFVTAHVKAFAYFGGVTRATVPDQLRSAVIVPSRYEPTINRTYAELGRHYGTAIVPARPRKPRDKAKVEVAVQVAQRWILARLRNETFFSHEALNVRIAELLEDMNARPMRRLGGVSRRELFERYERASLQPLPHDPFIVSEWSRSTVELDYHVRLDDHFYSVPFTLCREDVETRMTASTIEVFRRGDRVAAHARSYVKFGKTTCDAHMPANHRAYCDAELDVTEWSANAGPMCAAMVKRIFDATPFRESAIRSAGRLRALAAKYGDERVEAACFRAIALGDNSVTSIARILKLGREAMPLPGADAEERPPIVHANVRGPGYYH